MLSSSSIAVIPVVFEILNVDPTSMEPSTNKPSLILTDDESDASVDSNVGQTGGMIRLRILKDLPEPILDESGEEIELLEGDSFNCISVVAETLIAAGWAEAVTLE